MGKRIKLRRIKENPDQNFIERNEDEITNLRSFIRDNFIYENYDKFISEWLGKNLYDFAYFILDKVFMNKKVEIENFENVPEKGPAIIASNHPYWVEPLFIAYELYQKRGQKSYFWGEGQLGEKDSMSMYVFKYFQKEMGDNVGTYLLSDLVSNVFSPFFQTEYYIPVYRGKDGREEMYKLTLEELKKDKLIMILPENPDAKDIKDTREMLYQHRQGCLYKLCFGIAGLVERAYNNDIKVPVIPAAVSGSGENILKPGIIKMRFDDPVYFSDYEGRKDFLKDLEKKIYDNVVDLYGLE
ncbi:lysophospholipid acyltransferase family protein [Nanoarchaeota archaeon]